MNQAALRTYIRKIERIYQTGNATEYTYRSALEDLLQAFDPTLLVTTEPKRSNSDVPDFLVTRNKTPLGYLETQALGVSLDQFEQTDQMKRYLRSLANLILTDYIEFRWYVANAHRMTARLIKAGSKDKWTPDTDSIEQVSTLFQGFLMAK